MEEDEGGNEREIEKIEKVVGRDYALNKVRAPNRAGVSLFIRPLTTIEGRLTTIIGELN